MARIARGPVGPRGSARGRRRLAVTWTDWCHTSWTREHGNSVPPDDAGAYLDPVAVKCFSASLTGIGHELVFTALGGFLHNVSFSSLLFSGSVWQPLLSGGDDEYIPLNTLHCSPLGECIDWSNSAFVFSSAVHLGSAPPDDLRVDWRGFLFAGYYPTYWMHDYIPVSCSTAGTGEVVRGTDYCAPGSYTVELLNHSSTPEPVSMALLGTGLAGVFGARRRRRGVAQER